MASLSFHAAAFAELVRVWANFEGLRPSRRNSFAIAHNFPPFSLYGKHPYDTRAQASVQAFRQAARAHVCNHSCAVEVLQFRLVDLNLQRWFPDNRSNFQPPTNNAPVLPSSRTDSASSAARRHSNKRPRRRGTFLDDASSSEDEDGDDDTEEEMEDDEEDQNDSCRHTFDPTLFPHIPSPDHLAHLLSEYAHVTSNDEMKQVCCACCSSRTSIGQTSQHALANLNFDILKDNLQCSTPSAPVEIFDPAGINAERVATFCDACSKCIHPTPFVSNPSLHSFTKLPRLSRANGLFIGVPPPQLACLTWVESMCVARARTSRCCIKLKGYGASHVSKGNVVILPQAAHHLSRTLPHSASEIGEDIVVIFVSPSAKPITVDQIPKNLLTVRRSKILEALLWLKENNPLWQDVTIDDRALDSYPIDGQLPIPCFNTIASAATEAEGDSYVPGAQSPPGEASAATADSFTSPHSSPTSSSSSSSSPSPSHSSRESTPASIVPPATSISGLESNDDMDGSGIIQVSGCLDSNNADFLADRRKLSALMNLKSGGKFLKYPSGSTPMKDYTSPDTFASLYPCLFPYGCGSFEDDLRPKKVSFKSHVKHLLRLYDGRFSSHITFPFLALNIIQRRKSSFQAYLQTTKDSFKHVASLLRKVTVDTLADMQNKIKPGVRYNPQSDEERSALKLLEKVNLMSTDIFGSAGSHKNMREELRALLRHYGMPCLFVTLNPADTFNPIVSIFAGRDIDLEARLGVNDNVAEEVTARFRAARSNPGASAEGFHFIVDMFIKIFLGYDEPNGGIFGKCLRHYGVVEAQGRGALHVHMLIWLDNSPSPLQLRQYVKENTEWRDMFCQWIDTIMCASLPNGTVASGRYPKSDDPDLPYVQRGEHRSLPLLQPPPRSPNEEAGFTPEVWQSINQETRDILELGQIHDHSFTCYKHLPQLRASEIDPDKDCRFNYPKPLTDSTHFDEDGTLNVKRTHDRLNMYNLIMVAVFKCNMDIKPVGSGTMGMAAVYYISNYISKTSLDTNTMFAALEARFRRAAPMMLSVDSSGSASSTNPAVIDVPVSEEAQVRSLLVRSCNALIGRQELSSEQVIHHLLGYPHRYTNNNFRYVPWWEMARHLQLVNKPSSQKSTSNNESNPRRRSTVIAEGADADEEELPGEGQAEGSDSGEGEEEEEGNDESQHVQLLPMESPDAEPQHTGGSYAVEDYVCRSESLGSLCYWDFVSKWEKVTVKRAKRSATNFLPSHPQAATHRLQRRRNTVTPLLMGPSIPKASPESAEIHARFMLALFHPWRSPADLTPRQAGSSYKSRFDTLFPCFSSEHRAIIGHMQEHTQCLDAKDDWSRQRRKRRGDLAMSGEGFDGYDDMDIDEGEGLSDEALEAVDCMLQESDPHDVENNAAFYEAIDVAEKYNVYKASHRDPFPRQHAYPAPTRFGPMEKEDADRSRTYRALQKAAALERMAGPQPLSSSESHSAPSAASTPLPHLTTLAGELDTLRERMSSARRAEDWERLNDERKSVLAVSLKYSLNREQRYVFAIFAEHLLNRSNVDRKQLKMMIGGPGGAGKSQVFSAMEELCAVLGLSHAFLLTAPTGIAASNIGGATIHSVLNLTRNYDALSNEGKAKIAHRLRAVSYLVIDEVCFIGVNTFHNINKVLKSVRGNLTDDFGGLNVILAGDAAQLPPVKDKALHTRIPAPMISQRAPHDSSTALNSLNAGSQTMLQAIVAFQSMTHVIVLKKVMRQKEPQLVDALNRLRYQMCTDEDIELFNRRILGHPRCEVDLQHLSIVNWLKGEEDGGKGGAPLVTQRNVTRERHSFKCAEALAAATGQDFEYYFSTDKYRKKPLAAVTQMQAWKTPWHISDNSCGRLPLVRGMPVTLNKNLAVEIGLAKSTAAVVETWSYVQQSSMRFPRSITLSVPSLKVTEPFNPLQPKEVVLGFERESVSVLNDQNASQKATISRFQLPIVPDFARTIYNSQGQSLHSMLCDLGSCKTGREVYVMLSRVKSLDGLIILTPLKNEQLWKAHASEELRFELERLQEESERTMAAARREIAWYDIDNDSLT